MRRYSNGVLVDSDRLTDRLRSYWNFGGPSAWLHRALGGVNFSPDGAFTGYQKKITVHRTSGVNDATNIYAYADGAALCEADYDDIRFTDIYGNDLDYWIESYDANSAVIWVECNTPASGTTPIFCYCGNAAAGAVSNGPNTFDYFQDFNALNTADLNGQDSWTANTAWDVMTTTPYEGAKAIRSQAGGLKIATRPLVVSGWNVALALYMRTSGVANPIAGIWYLLQNTTQITGVYLGGSDFKHLRSAAWDSLSTTPVNNTYYKVEIALPSASTHKVWINDAEKALGNNSNINNVSSAVNKLHVEHYSGGTYDMFFDLIVQRKYTANEPTWQTFGAWETKRPRITIIR
ncbi:MAG: DUF2341 domain-containing protein [Planctomycetota bacterium]